jgi:hypothetical protein
VIRPFVIEELKQTFVPGIALAGAAAILTLLAKPIVLRLVAGPLEAQAVINGLVTAMLVGTASAGGSAAFGLSFRQGPLRLLENMPIARLRIWGVRLLVSVLTTVSSAGLLIAADVEVLDQSRETIVATLAVACVVFTAGLCSGILVQAGTAIVVVLNVILSFPVMVFLFSLAFLVSGGSSLAPLFAVASIPVCVVNLVFCGSVFLRGEFDIWRQRLRNTFALIGALVTMAVALTLAADFGAFALGDDWVIAPGNSVSWSSDRRYLGLILQKGEHASTTKAVVIDVDAGTIVKTFRQNSIRDSVWTPDGTWLVASDGTVFERFFGTGGGTVRVTRIFPSEERLFNRSRSRLVRMVRANQAGVVLILNSQFRFKRWEGVTSLIRLDSPGTSQEILTRPWTIASFPGTAWQHPDHIFFSENDRGGGWLIGKDIRRLSHSWGPFMFQDEAAMKAHKINFNSTMPGQTDNAQRRGVYVWSDFDLFPCDENCWVYFLDVRDVDRLPPHGTLFARRYGDDSWKPVFDNIPLTMAQVNKATRMPGEYSHTAEYSLWTGQRSGIALRIYRSGAKSVISLANLVTGEHFDFDDENVYQPDHSQQVSAFASKSSVDIITYRVPKITGIAQPIRYAYRPGGGMPTPIRPVRQPGPAGTAVSFRSPKGIGVIINPNKIIARSPDGTTRQLWPQ